jgi:hypothetical protein
MKKQNYLNNRDILKEIHKSKTTFCSFTNIIYNEFDSIIHSLSEINEDLILESKKNQIKREGTTISDPSTLQIQNIVFRLMTYDHIPDEPGRKKNPKTVADRKVKLNFPPFQHWKFNDNNELICVGKSHWKGDLNNGNFCMTHGNTTDKLALMWMKLCERYATRGNVRGYTYNDEMRGQAILQLAQIGLQFDESKSQNPFAYYTAAVTNSFVRVINLEKRNQNIRDDILEMNNMNPSYTRQANDEWAVALKREAEFQENNTF